MDGFEPPNLLIRSQILCPTDAAVFPLSSPPAHTGMDETHQAPVACYDGPLSPSRFAKIILPPLVGSTPVISAVTRRPIMPRP